MIRSAEYWRERETRFIGVVEKAGEQEGIQADFKPEAGMLTFFYSNNALL